MFGCLYNSVLFNFNVSWYFLIFFGFVSNKLWCSFFVIYCDSNVENVVVN